MSLFYNRSFTHTVLAVTKAKFDDHPIPVELSIAIARVVQDRMTGISCTTLLGVDNEVCTLTMTDEGYLLIKHLIELYLTIYNSDVEIIILVTPLDIGDPVIFSVVPDKFEVQGMTGERLVSGRGKMNTGEAVVKMAASIKASKELLQ